MVCSFFVQCKYRLYKISIMKTYRYTVHFFLITVWSFILFHSLSIECALGNRYEPDDGTCYIGISPDTHKTPPLSLDEKTGIQHAAFMYTFTFPLSNGDMQTIKDIARQLNDDKHNRLLILTLEPWEGLEKVTPEACHKLAKLCAAYPMPILIRFAPEMNASWYPWGQRPTQYKQVFRKLAKVLHTESPKTGMIWSPINGLGYPFSSGQYACGKENPEFKLLDTNYDDKLCQNDDMYTPFYPGDDVVDWVGMGILHLGPEHALGNNALPGIDLADGILRGEYSIPSFYDLFCRKRNAKPLVITALSALYDPDKGGECETEIKQAMIKQFYDPARLRKLRRLKMIIWLDKYRNEPCVNAKIDWRVSNNPDVTEAYKNAIQIKGPGNRPVFLQAPDAARWLK